MTKKALEVCCSCSAIGHAADHEQVGYRHFDTAAAYSTLFRWCPL
jgi:diketogulonate reductase-like aldo/keto reductase